MNRLKNTLPMWAFVLGGTLVLAQSTTQTGRTFPYVGYLEENGVAVNGNRDLELTLFTAATGNTSCDSEVFSDIVVSEGRFQVAYPSVPDACLKTGELYIDVSVGAAGGARTTLAAADGTHTRVHAVPFASANDKSNALLVGTGNVTFERSGGQTRLSSSSGATALFVHPNEQVADGNGVFIVEDHSGNARLRVEANSAVRVLENFTVSGSSTLSSTLSVTGATTLGNALNVNHVANVATLKFPSQGGANNDQGLIEHFESGNTGELYLSSSDDWDGTTTNDRIVFGQRGRLDLHEFDSAGNATHLGDLTVGGAISSTCPTGMSRIGSNCIDNNKRGNATFAAAMTICNDLGKSICTYDDMIMCDQLAPPGSNCDSDTNNAGVTMWTRTRQTERDDFDETWQGNLACYIGTDKIDECATGEQHEYYCCAGGIYAGTP